METPERNQIGSSMSKYEDSPVFNYLSNLSPIKTSKSAHIAQTFTSLNFNSIPSVFTSPHIISHKESRFVKRQKTPDKSQPDVSYIDVDANKENEVFVDINQLRSSSSEFYQKSHGEAFYDQGSPKGYSEAHKSSGEDASQSAAVTSSVTFSQGTSTSVPAVHEGSSRWESLVSGGSDLLMFDSPSIFKDLTALFRSPPTERAGPSLVQPFPQKSPDFLTSDSASVVNISEFQNERHLLETEGIICDHSEYPDSMTQCTTNCNPVGTSNDEQMTALHRGVRRRCLVFDKRAQSYSKNLTSAATSNPSESNNTLSLRVLPGIGLHLNTLAVSPDSTLGAQTKVSSSIVSFPSPATSQEKESLDEILTRALSEKIIDSDISHRNNEDDSLELDLVSFDDFNQNSPEHKRHKQGSSGDESCKRCNCKKSKCLKLYCECFAAGVHCIGACACQGCMNRPEHEQTITSTRKLIESRNPLAFAPKVIITSEPHLDVKDEVMNTPASARHKRGCNCKKSGCKKKYCECYQAGVGCSINCRCESCKNMFGTKDGKGLVPVAQEYDSQTQKARKKMNGKCPRKIISQNNEEHDVNTFPETPLHIKRMSDQVPFSKCSLLTSDSANRTQFRKPSHFNPSSKIERNHPSREDITEEEHELLQSNGSPDTSMKITSSSDISNFSSSSGRRSTRKLMLRSIPSFPSLTQP